METREEIKHIIDELPETILDELLNYLRSIETASKDKIELSQNLRKILIEDSEVLKKLAQ